MLQQGGPPLHQLMRRLHPQRLWMTRPLQGWRLPLLLSPLAPACSPPTAQPQPRRRGLPAAVGRQPPCPCQQRQGLAQRGLEAPEPGQRQGLPLQVVAGGRHPPLPLQLLGHPALSVKQRTATNRLMLQQASFPGVLLALLQKHSGLPNAVRHPGLRPAQLRGHLLQAKWPMVRHLTQHRGRTAKPLPLPAWQLLHQAAWTSLPA